jgi:hypothetical protein
MAREICLNLEREVLEGYEKSRTYDLLNVEVLKIARGLGHQLPAVDVVYENGLYRLAFGIGVTSKD